MAAENSGDSKYAYVVVQTPAWDGCRPGCTVHKLPATSAVMTPATWAKYKTAVLARSDQILTEMHINDAPAGASAGALAATACYAQYNVRKLLGGCYATGFQQVPAEGEMKMFGLDPIPYAPEFFDLIDRFLTSSPPKPVIEARRSLTFGHVADHDQLRDTIGTLAATQPVDYQDNLHDDAMTPVGAKSIYSQ